MSSDIIGKILNELDSLGFPGVVMLLLICAIIHLWRELKAERQRCEALAEKLDTMSRETITMVERIIGSK